MNVQYIIGMRLVITSHLSGILYIFCLSGNKENQKYIYTL